MNCPAIATTTESLMTALTLPTINLTFVQLNDQYGTNLNHSNTSIKDIYWLAQPPPPRTHTLARMHTRTHTCTHKITHAHRLARMRTHTRTHAHTPHARTRMHTRSRTHGHINANAHTRRHTRAHTKTRVHMHAHANTHADTRGHTHTWTHTRTRTHTQVHMGLCSLYMSLAVFISYINNRIALKIFKQNTPAITFKCFC